MVRTLNSPILAIVLLFVVIWLGIMSREQEVGYDHSEFDVLKTHKQSKADALKDVWQLTDADISKPVVLW